MATSQKRDRPMTEETLRQLLSRVHERLSSSGSVDSETREMLATVMRDIEGALGKGAAGPSLRALPPSVTAAPVSAEALLAATQPRLEALAVRF